LGPIPFDSPSRFDGLLDEAKNDELEGRKARKNPTARLIHRIMEAVGAPVALPKVRTVN
jgi:hypothetical protein